MTNGVINHYTLWWCAPHRCTHNLQSFLSIFFPVSTQSCRCLYDPCSDQWSDFQTSDIKTWYENIYIIENLIYNFTKQKYLVVAFIWQTSSQHISNSCQVCDWFFSHRFGDKVLMFLWSGRHAATLEYIFFQSYIVYSVIKQRKWYKSTTECGIQEESHESVYCKTTQFHGTNYEFAHDLISYANLIFRETAQLLSLYMQSTLILLIGGPVRLLKRPEKSEGGPLW